MTGDISDCPEMVGLSLENRIKRVMARALQANEPFNTVELNPEDWQALADSLEYRGTRQVEFVIGPTFPIMRWVAYGRVVRVLPNANVPAGKRVDLYFEERR